MARRSARNSSGAVPDSLGRQALRAWARRHAYGFFSSIGELVRRPINSVMTISVLALALALPIGLSVIVKQVSELTDGVSREHTLSVFLADGASETDVLKLASEWSGWEDVLAVDPISPEQGLADTLAFLDLMQPNELNIDNPLPWVLVLTPTTIDAVPFLASRLSTHTSVAQVIVDLEWVERLDAWLQLGERLVWVLGSLLLLAFLFVIAHTIRMEVHQRKHQIEVMALVGATPAFIRRPFLYSGFWFGSAAAIISLAIVWVAWKLTQAPLSVLLGSAADVEPSLGISTGTALLLIFGMGFVGTVGSSLAVREQLLDVWPK